MDVWLGVCFSNRRSTFISRTYNGRYISQFMCQMNNLYLPLACEHTDIDRGRPAACCLLCAAHLGISLMQGDAMKEQSDANPAVFVWGAIMHLCLHVCLCLCVCVCVCLSVCCHLCHDDLVTSYLRVGASASAGSCAARARDSVVCSRLRMRRPNPLFLRTARRSAVNLAHLLICSLA